MVAVRRSEMAAAVTKVTSARRSVLVAEREAERAAEVQAAASLSFFDWAQRVPEPKTGTLDFDRFPFQREWYRECGDVQELVIQKPTQVGASAFAVRLAMYHPDVHRRTAMYVFPGARQVNDFSDSRVKPAIEGSPYLMSRIPKSNVANKGLRQIGGGFLVMRGSRSSAGLQSVDADALFLDEYDELEAENMPDAERRITGSEHGVIVRLGVPTHADWGINEQFEASDQRRWFSKCDGCGLRQTPVFEDHVDLDRVLVVCSACRRPLDVGTGEWVAEYPGREVRGYQLNRLIVPGVARNHRGSLAGIIKASLKRTPFEIEAFHQKDLGLPWTAGENRLSDEAIRAAQSAGNYVMTPDVAYRGLEVVTMGVDVATKRDLNVRISAFDEVTGKKRALYLGVVDSFDEVDRLIQFFQVQMACIDHLPEGRLAMATAERFPGRVFLVSYGTPAQADVLNIDEGRRHVSVRRLEAIDATIGMVREQRNLLPRNLPSDYVRQMRNAARVQRLDEDTGKIVVRYRRLGPDDWLQCETYDTVAMDVYRWRVATEEARGELQPLDRYVDFPRADLDFGEQVDMDYEPGMGNGYDPGMRE